MKHERPDREPDLTLPEADQVCKVELWIEEEIFCLRDSTYHTGISQSGINCNHNMTPLEYIRAVAERGKEPIHQELAVGFIAERLLLDLE